VLKVLKSCYIKVNQFSIKLEFTLFVVIQEVKKEIQTLCYLKSIIEYKQILNWVLSLYAQGGAESLLLNI
jgi:hypothetical protein